MIVRTVTSENKELVIEQTLYFEQLRIENSLVQHKMVMEQHGFVSTSDNVRKSAIQIDTTSN